MNSAAQANANFWDKLAPRYAAMPVKDVEAYEATLDAVKARLRPEHWLLEIGCGTGSTALRLAPFVEKVVATDISAAMIEIARAKPEANKIDFRQQEASAPFAEERFDVVCAFNVLHLVPDLDQTLRRIRQQLKSDGIFISKTPCLGEMSIFIRAIVPVMRLIGMAPPVQYQTRQKLLSALAVAGFAVEETRTFGKGRASHYIVARPTDRPPGN
ncbi:class I SAM-dependent methyltransferase [Peteryoungia desertarenae]|uniref:Class I SAM-dependent methyltransferase n=1 Tax=Peteryoungia desertarenae TaxID=1813451 RepID=A0ABX6QNS6_9HYPH|nr:class I SAM-dependent methyltransferase [Peteryoungia desertarenae]QLF70188.1 class I SAM-dependent methyltransferase [Peteryoungia desertarenae]